MSHDERKLTQRVLCPHERHSNDGLTCEACMDLDFISAEIPRLHQLILQYERKHRVLQMGYNAVHSPIVRLLPAELLAVIFEYFLPAEDSNSYFRSPWIFGSVCRWWREVTLSTSSLWCYPTIRLSTTRLSNTSLNGAFLQKLLSRSAERPLTVLIIGYNVDHLASENARLLCDALNAQAHRWKRLTCFVPPSFLTYLHGPKSSPASTTPTPILESIQILSSFHTIEEDSRNVVVPVDIGSHLPLLSRVKLSGFRIELFRIDWSNVTHIEADDFYIDEILEILRQAQRIEVGDFRIINGRSGKWEIPSTPIKNFNLKFLKCVFEEEVFDPEPLNFFESLTLPTLKFLEIDVKNAHLPVVGLIQFLQRSMCTLTDLHIVRSWVEEDDLIRLLQQIPSLQSLGLETGPEEDISYLTDAFIFHLASTSIFIEGSADAFLPNLRSFYHSGLITYSWNHLPELVDYQHPDLPNISEPATTHPDGVPPAGTGPRYIKRPLQEVFITLNEPEYGHFPGKATKERLSKIGESGCYFEIFDFGQQMGIFSPTIPRDPSLPLTKYPFRKITI